MAARGAVPHFRPSVNGFRFTNSFPPAPTIRLDLGLAGRVGLGNASQGMCGGMVFGARDFFQAALPLPTDDRPPAQGTALFDFIAARLLDSFNGPGGISQYAQWMLMPSADMNLFFLTRRGTFARSVLSSWPTVRADIDAGLPSPLALVTVHTADLSKIGRCHQVLAYGYSVDNAGAVVLDVYDPNTGPDSADDVHISFDAADPHHVSPITHNINIDGTTLHGFFRSSFTPKIPPAGL